MKKKFFSFSAMLIAGLLFIGCENTTDPETDNSILFEDAAESISAAVGDESGGATDNFADVMIAAGGGSMNSNSPVIDGGDLVTLNDPLYDSLTGWWSVSVNRSFQNTQMQRSITREYRYQFRRNGTAQKFYATGGDTATSLSFKIVSGSGYFRGPRVNHTMTQLKGAWTSNNIDKDTVTITLDSTYVRSGTDTIKTRNMLRTHTSTLTITSVDVKAPRYKPLQRLQWRENFHQAISGNIKGHYSALITFERGDAYKERSVESDFDITIGNGEGAIGIEIKGKRNRFSMNLQMGQRK